MVIQKIGMGLTMTLINLKKIVGRAVIVMAIGTAVGNADARENSEAPPELDVTVRSDTPVPLEDRMEWVKQQMDVSKTVFRRVQNMLDRARREKDTIKITCLDDKLTQIHVNIRGMEEREAALRAATETNDDSTSEQQFTVLKIYVSRIQSLWSEAENCIGESDVVIGNSETTVTVDEDITVEDPTNEGQDIYQQIGTEQIPHASGYY